MNQKMFIQAEKQSQNSTITTSRILQGKHEECQKKKLLYRYAKSPDPDTAPPIVNEVLNSSGVPLDKGTQTFMEHCFGHDFSQVRVHADEKAAESARA